MCNIYDPNGIFLTVDPQNSNDPTYPIDPTAAGLIWVDSPGH